MPVATASQPATDTAADARVADAVRAWVDSILAQNGTAANPLHETLMAIVETTLVQKVVDAAHGNRTAAAPGDKVVTSGDAEAFPPGLPIGQVARVDDGVVEVEPFVGRDKLQHVRVVDFGLEGILADQPAPPPAKK